MSTISQTYYDGYPLTFDLTIPTDTDTTYYYVYDRNGYPYHVTKKVSNDGNLETQEFGESNGVSVKINNKFINGDSIPVQSDTIYNDGYTKQFNSYPYFKKEFEKIPFTQAGVTDLQSLLNWGKHTIGNYFDYLKRSREYPSRKQRYNKLQ